MTVLTSGFEPSKTEAIDVNSPPIYRALGGLLRQSISSWPWSPANSRPSAPAIGLYCQPTINSKRSSPANLRPSAQAIGLYCQPTTNSKLSSPTTSEGLPIMPTCASPTYRHYSGHRHYWEYGYYRELLRMHFKSCQAISPVL